MDFYHDLSQMKARLARYARQILYELGFSLVIVG